MIVLRRLAVVICLGLLIAAAPAAAQTTRITFVLVNDIYLMDEQPMPDGRARGGFARLAAVVKAERAKGGHVIFAHAGDTLSPSLMSGIDRGEHIVTLTNMAPPDIFVPGNHEFDFGKAVFLRRMAEAKFPLYAANLRGPDGAPIRGFRDRAMLTFDGVRIGVTGTTYDDTARTSSPEDLRIGPTIETARQQLDALRREGADFTVAVIHADRPQDLTLYGSRAADLILSGHDHDLLVNFDGRNALVESSHDAHYVAMIDVTITVKTEGGRREVAWWPDFRIVDTADVTPDPAVAAQVAAFGSELSREMDVPLGTTAIPLDSRNATVRTREAAIGDLIADAMRESTRSDAALVNGGSIRSGRVLPPGSAITRRDVLAEMPFSNRIMVLEMSGAALRAALENGVSLLPNAGGRFPQVSGLRIEVDTARKPGERIVAITIGDHPLDDSRIYRVATNDFLARGGDGYTSFRDARRLSELTDAPLLANAVMVHIRRLGVIAGGPDGRIAIR